ncbi:UNVERIFIED_CONTAM: hypothetical protein GTU68_039524 [Idotea baltica]|nr:hypothetical protein [Idotea baltica]
MSDFDFSYSRKDFGKPFHFGVSTASHQIEGAWNVDGKGESIWDRFAHTPKKIERGEHADVSLDFYHRYKEDLKTMSSLSIPNYRFSVAWSRVKPLGYGKVNEKGVDYYNRVIDTCLENGIEPWITLYHWDLPQNLQDLGGWSVRQIRHWFEEYAELCAKRFGDRVKNWMVLNEPVAFTVLGNLLGIHAPGKRNPSYFLKSVHHAALCQAIGGRVLREHVKNVNVGTTVSCSYVEPYKQEKRHIKAAARVEAILNRLFLEPALGLGYPWEGFNFLKRLENHMQPGDEKALEFDFDFWGVQYYTREIVKHTPYIPFVQASLVDPKDKGAEQITDMNWEVFPQGLYSQLKKFAEYKEIKKLIVTENGSAFPDVLTADGRVHDVERTNYLRQHLAACLKAKNEGVPLEGYFYWTYTDNFEWAFGYRPRFGLVYNDFSTQKRYVKDSGFWMRDFLDGKQVGG